MQTVPFESTSSHSFISAKFCILFPSPQLYPPEMCAKAHRDPLLLYFPKSPSRRLFLVTYWDGRETLSDRQTAEPREEEAADWQARKKEALVRGGFKSSTLRSSPSAPAPSGQRHWGWQRLNKCAAGASGEANSVPEGICRAAPR